MTNFSDCCSKVSKNICCSRYAFQMSKSVKIEKFPDKKSTADKCKLDMITVINIENVGYSFLAKFPNLQTITFPPYCKMCYLIGKLNGNVQIENGCVRFFTWNFR